MLLRKADQTSSCCRLLYHMATYHHGSRLFFDTSWEMIKILFLSVVKYPRTSTPSFSDGILSYYDTLPAELQNLKIGENSSPLS